MASVLPYRFALLGVRQWVMFEKQLATYFWQCSAGKLMRSLFDYEKAAVACGAGRGSATKQVTRLWLFKRLEMTPTLSCSISFSPRFVPLSPEANSIWRSESINFAYSARQHSLPYVEVEGPPLNKSKVYRSQSVLNTTLATSPAAAPEKMLRITYAPTHAQDTRNCKGCLKATQENGAAVTRNRIGSGGSADTLETRRQPY